jgi:hypothetical protein
LNDRVTLKESIGKAISYGISPGTELRIGAFAHTGKLGMLLWEWKFAGLSKGLEAENLLTRRMAKRLRIRHVGSQKQEYLTLRLACRQVLYEWYLPECPTCSGVKEITGEHKRVVCETCKGLGLKHFHDYERSDAIGVQIPEYKKTWDKRFREIRDMIVGQDAETGSIVREQLKTLGNPDYIR